MRPPAQLRWIVHALTGDVEERPFDVNAENPRNARRDRAAHRGDGMRDDIEVRADQRRQEAGGAEAAMCGADGADRLHARRIVEQHPATAIHLQVDEARQQQASAEVIGLRRAAARIIGRQHIDDAALLDEHTLAADEGIRAQHSTVQQGDAHQSVSVTLRRWGGASGSCPRVSDSAFAMR